MWPTQFSRWTRLAFLSACSAITAWSIDASRTPSQYVREKWGPDRGFPRGPVYCIAQTADGFLWIGTERGLVRFDGLDFQLTGSAGQEQPDMGRVLGLVVDPDDNLWMRAGRS